MTIALRLLAILSAVAALLAYGLSGMASDDVSRSGEAHALQLLMLAWVAASIAAPFAAAAIARGNPRAAPLAYLPMVLLGMWAIVSLARF